MLCVLQESCSVFSGNVAAPCAQRRVLRGNSWSTCYASCAPRQQLLHVSCAVLHYLREVAPCALLHVLRKSSYFIGFGKAALGAPRKQPLNVLCCVCSGWAVPCAPEELLYVLQERGCSMCTAPCAPGIQLVHVLYSMCSETAVAASAVLYFLREVAVTWAVLKVLGDSTCSISRSLRRPVGDAHSARKQGCHCQL